MKKEEIKLEFNSLAKEVESQFKKAGVQKEDIKEAIKWAKKN